MRWLSLIFKNRYCTYNYKRPSFLRQFLDGLTTPKMDLSLTTSKEYFFLGEKIEGKIVLKANEYVEVEQTVVQLSCMEHGRVLLYNKKITHSLGYNLSSGETRQISCDFNIPFTSRPTIKSVDDNVDWWLEVSVWCKERQPLRQLFEIQVAKPQSNQISSILQKEVMTEREIIYCRHCGTKNNARSLHCTHCNAPQY